MQIHNGINMNNHTHTHTHVSIHSSVFLCLKPDPMIQVTSSLT